MEEKPAIFKIDKQTVLDSIVSDSNILKEYCNEYQIIEIHISETCNTPVLYLPFMVNEHNIVIFRVEGKTAIKVIYNENGDSIFIWGDVFSGVSMEVFQFLGRRWVLQDGLLINSQDDLNTIEDNPEAIANYYNVYQIIKVVVSNANWIPSIILPLDILEEKLFIFQHNSDLDTNIIYNENNDYAIHSGSYLFKNNQWYVPNRPCFVFNEYKNTVNDLTAGELQAQIMYAQNIIINNKYEEHWPHLVGNRDTLLMYVPINPLNIEGDLFVKGLDNLGNHLGELKLLAPNELPAHDGPSFEQHSVYAENVWSVILPHYWLNNGLTLQFTNNNLVGNVEKIIIGAPNELILQTLDIGLLTPPRNQFQFMEDTQVQLDYFQKIPLSKMIVSTYEPMHLTKVVLPDGTVYTDASAEVGEWHRGDMSDYVARGLIAYGINLSNYGIHSSNSSRERADIFYSFSAHVTVLNVVGNYANGIIVHGGYANLTDNLCTIENSIGNEFSHEVGHTYGLMHYMGGSLGSIHRPSTDIMSTWGWDRSLNRFIANFFWHQDGDQICVDCGDGVVVPPFYHHKFHTSSMNGATTDSTYTQYSLHTPYELNHMQNNYFENKIVFDKNSSTGFKQWNNTEKKMQEAILSIPNNLLTYKFTNEDFIAIQEDQEGIYISELLLKYNHLDITLLDRNDGVDFIVIPTLNEDNYKNRFISIESQSNSRYSIYIDGIIIYMNKGQKLIFKLEGLVWRYIDNLPTTTNVQPVAFGVPVVTIVGYYDPQEILSSYLYPALYGSYGHVYKSDIVTSEHCFLRVYTQNGSYDYILNNELFEQNTIDTSSLSPHKAYNQDFTCSCNINVENQNKMNYMMNQLHVNIAQSDNPYKAEVIYKDKILSTLDIPVSTHKVFYTINSIPYNSVFEITNQGLLNEIAMDSKVLERYYNNYFKIYLNTYDALYVEQITLPVTTAVDKQVFEYIRNSSGEVCIICNDGEQYTPELGQKLTLMFEEGKWVGPLFEITNQELLMAMSIDSSILSYYYNQNKTILLRTVDGFWVQNLTLPIASEGRIFILERFSLLAINIICNDGEIYTPDLEQTLTLIFKEGKWVVKSI